MWLHGIMWQCSVRAITKLYSAERLAQRLVAFTGSQVLLSPVTLFTGLPDLTKTEPLKRSDLNKVSMNWGMRLMIIYILSHWIHCISLDCKFTTSKCLLIMYWSTVQLLFHSESQKQRGRNLQMFYIWTYIDYQNSCQCILFHTLKGNVRLVY